MNKKFQEFEDVICTLKEIAQNAIVIDGQLFINSSSVQQLGDILTNIERCPYSAKIMFIEALTQLVGPFELAVRCDANAENSNQLFYAVLRSANKEILPEWNHVDDNGKSVKFSFSYCAEEAVANIGVSLIKNYLEKHAESR